MKESLSVRFLYQTVPGRMVLKLLVHPGLSKAAGVFLDSSLSRFLIRPFQKSNGIRLDGIAVPEGGFPSFNSFFSRKKKEVVFSEKEDVLCSPCDGFLTCWTMDSDSRFDIKHSVYSAESLLEDPELASFYKDGVAMIFRLTPAHYHRYHHICDAEVLGSKRIEGVLHCVRPMALDRYPVFVQNTREYTVLNSENLGRVTQMEVGALMVGRIRNHPLGRKVLKGEEKGCFEFGGSTIVLFVQKDVLKTEDLASCLDNGSEIPVTLGSALCSLK